MCPRLLCQCQVGYLLVVGFEEEAIIKSLNSAPTSTRFTVVVTPTDELMASKCYPIQRIRLQVTRKTASSISSMELQHCYAIFCLCAYRVKWLHHVSDPSALQQSSKLRNNTKVRALQQWEKEKTGHSSLP